MGDPWGMIYGGSGWRHDTANDPLGEKSRADARRYRDAGVGSTRLGACWCNVEKVRGTYDWSELDAAVHLAADAGLRIVLCVATTPQWAWQHPEAEAILVRRKQANLAGCLPPKPEYWPDYERYLAALVQRCKPHLKHYEIWNEPDGMAGLRFVLGPDGRLVDVQYGGDPAWYAELVTRSYRIIKSIDPAARVGIGSFEKKDAAKPDCTAFLEGMYEHGVHGHFDAISMHAYGNPFAREWLGAVRRTMDAHGDADKPIWVTEYNLIGSGAALAFETRRQLRLLRETPWISVAQPLVFAAHLDPKISPGGLSLRAHRQMADEIGPRAEFTADFEGRVLGLLDRWEWNASGSGNIDGPEVRTVYPHGGEAHLAAASDQDMVRVWFTPYVSGRDRVFSGHLLVEPASREANVSISVGAECGNVLEPIREIRPLIEAAPLRRWFHFEAAVDRRWPEWNDQAVVTCYVEVRADAPGLTVYVDDVRVGPSGDGATASRPADTKQR